MAPASGLKASSLSPWHCCTSRNPPLPKSTDLLIRKVPFQRLAREVLQDLNRPGSYPHFTANVFRRLLCWLFKNLWKHSASDCLRMQTCVRSMPGGSPSCRKTCNLHCE
eukprot:CCRYP_020510-RB/>CCRYP_020510-RB protein AED:0.15 eAED:0.58 QI:0/-1/0/1/-1/0/1/0/108